MSGRRFARWLLLPAAIPVLAVAHLNASAATTLDVPGAYPTVQSAIDAAGNGDVVSVAPGVYNENIDFKGKAITVTSTQGPAVTIIDGGKRAHVVNFSHSEGQDSILQGFTLQNGFDEYNGGGGIEISYASPTIQGNVITQNGTCTWGAGIDVSNGSPAILGNMITNNVGTYCDGWGGGISIEGGTARVVGNTISHNHNYSGGGIGMDTGLPIIQNNVISDNDSVEQGAGVWVQNAVNFQLLQNLVTGNHTLADGGGLWFSTPRDTPGPVVVTNTFADNAGRDGAEVWAGGFAGGAQLFNNVMQSSNGSSAIYCDTFWSPTPPQLDHNDAFATSGGPAFAEACAGAAGTNGNISADPTFAGSNDYHLAAASPCIDAGNSSAPGLPSTDLDGKPRIVGAAVDQGAYESSTPPSGG